MVRTGAITGVTADQAVKNLIKALGKGVLKVMSKMGISTVASYRGAQVFEAIGLSQELVDEYFTGTVSQLGGVGLDVIADGGRRAARARHTRRTGSGRPTASCVVGGEYQWRREGEPHLFDPDTVFRLQHATRARRYDVFKEYTRRIDDQSERLMTLRGLFELGGVAAPAAGADRGGRAGQRDRQAVQHRRDELRLDQPGGPRDARDRDEPPRRPVEHRARAARTSSGSWTPSGARRSSRSPRAGSGSPRSTSPTPTTSRSRWPRAPSPARAASCPGPRSTRGWPRRGTRRPGVGLISPAAAPRHLLDRGPRPAHPRPQERQPGRRGSTSSSSPRSASAPSRPG